MAILHIQLDIDSDVLPELHAVLSAITKNLSRAERLRQLASAGLIWEHLRVHTNATASGVSPALLMASGTAALPDAGADIPPDERVLFPVPAPQVEPIDLDGLAPLDEAPSVVEPKPRYIPVLQDVVEEVDTLKRAGGRADGPVSRKTSSSSSGARVKADGASALKPDSGAGRKVADAAAELPDGAAAPGPLSTAARKPGAKSRLVRMQEKGLFKNG